MNDDPGSAIDRWRRSPSGGESNDRQVVPVVVIDSAGMAGDDPAGEVETFATKPRANAHIRLIALSILGFAALVLLVLGGYGLMQEHAAAQDEIRGLRAALAGDSSPDSVANMRAALQEIEQQSAKYQATIEIQKLYNEHLANRVAELEQQLAVQQGEAPRKAGSGPALETETSTEPAADSAEVEMATGQDSAVVAEGGEWFVNFGSYNRRSAAEKWLTKMSPVAGKAVVVPVQADDKTIYRVRIIGLADRAQAGRVAEELQTSHNLPPLWLGRD